MLNYIISGKHLTNDMAMSQKAYMEEFIIKRLSFLDRSATCKIQKIYNKALTFAFNSCTFQQIKTLRMFLLALTRLTNSLKVKQI